MDGEEKAHRQGNNVGNLTASPGKKEVGLGREDRKEATLRLAAGQEGQDLAAERCKGCGNVGDYRQRAPRFSDHVSGRTVAVITVMLVLS